MGLLDEAIRQHLELKRKHGADPKEIAQQEREALGPPGGAQDPAAAPAPDQDAADAPPAREAAPPDPGPDDDPLEPDIARSHDPEPDIEWSAPPPARGPEAEVPDEPRQSPPPPAEPQGRVETAGQPTREYSADELRELGDDAPPQAGGDVPPEVVPADEEPGEDVLDETPEFLQETPEHDRLWFEQKPPRDFDF